MSKPRFTASPWRWEVNRKSKSAVLAGGCPKYDLHVMDFVRWGLQGAAPRFLDIPESTGGLMLMERVEKFVVAAPGREHHFSWFGLIDHPNATLIARAPELAELLWQTREVIAAMPQDALGEASAELLDKINRALDGLFEDEMEVES